LSLVLDTGALYAWYDRDDRWHGAVRALLDADTGALIVPAAVIPEVDYLLGRAIGTEAQLALYDDLTISAFLVTDLDEAGYRRVLELNRRYRDLQLGFVDAAVMATVESLGIGRIATTDRRDFSAVNLEIEIELLP
jgi:predicted nucleic acid-binding protein